MLLERSRRNYVIRNNKETLITLSRVGMQDLTSWFIHSCKNGIGFVALPSLTLLQEWCVTALLDNDPILNDLVEFTKIIELMNRPNETLYLYLETKY